LREHPEWADRLIANKLGRDGKTVETVRDELEATAQIAQSDRLLGADGKWYSSGHRARLRSEKLHNLSVINAD
jgi:hypothetical protein